MNEAAFKFKTFSEKTRKQYGFWVRYPWRLIETEVKPTCRSGGSAVAKAHTTVPLDASRTWEWLELFPEALMILLSLSMSFVCLFTQLIHKLLSLWFSCSMWPWECRWSENGLSEWSLSCCAHGSHCTWDGPENGLVEISKLHDYLSLPGACWLEMLFDLLWSP